MTIQHFPDVEGPVLIRPKVFGDERGYFFESYNDIAFAKAGLPTRFRQDNQSKSAKGVLRGLHFQAPPFAQGKLVRVVQGSVMDVVVDIRKNSPSYGKHISVFLNAKDHDMFWVPPGFAHGFLTLEDDTIFLYKCTEVYNKASEGGLMWNDPAFNINWQIDQPLLSEKDEFYTPFNQFISPFNHD